MVYMAKDSDFEKQDNYWIYKGQEKEVEIPEYINGELLTSTAFMFAQTNNFWSSPVTKVVLKHSRVNDMNSMFQREERAEESSLDLTNFNTSNVVNMGYMFMNFNSKTIDLSSFDTSNVRNMNNMFDGCVSLSSLDVSGFDTSRVTNFEYMFNNCYRLEKLDLSNFVIKENAKTNSMLSFGKSKIDVYVASKEYITKLKKNINSFSMPTFHIVKKYLDFEGLRIYNEKVKEEIEKLINNGGQGVSVEIVGKEQIGETPNNSIIFVRK